MAFISVLLALLIEQIKPLPMHNPVYSLVRNGVGAFNHYFNGGERSHGVIAWWVLAALAVILAWNLYWLAGLINPLLALAVNVVVLYLTLGFRQFSHAYTQIQSALESGDLLLARRVLGEWMQDAMPGFVADQLSPNEIARYAIERALMLSHRHVFGVFFWFVLLPGPVGAVLYRVTQLAARSWRRAAPNSVFAQFAERAYTTLDWLPARLTALGFAVVGNFEDAVFGWRNEAKRWRDPSDGVVLAAGAGALGIRLGGSINTPLQVSSITTGESGLEVEGSLQTPTGVPVEPGHLKSAVGLVWRAMTLWLFLVLMISIAAWVT